MILITVDYVTENSATLHSFNTVCLPSIYHRRLYFALFHQLFRPYIFHQKLWPLNKLGMKEVRLDKLGTKEVGLDKVGIDNVGLDEVGMDEVATGHTGYWTKWPLDEVGIGQSRIGQTGNGQTGNVQSGNGRTGYKTKWG